MNSEAQRKASAAYHAKREAEGLKKVTLWLSPEARLKLDTMKAAAGSKDRAAELAILAWGTPEGRAAVNMLAASILVDAAAKEAPMRLPRAPVGSLLDKKRKR